MKTDRLSHWLGIGALGLLCAAACWLRLTGYSTAPEFTADESIYGIQTLRLLRDGSCSMWTQTGHLLSPFLMAMQAPLVVALEPSSTILRLPVTVCGIAAVVLAYQLGARVFDRTTGLLAAGLLAVLPVAVIYSRIAWEPGLIPLYAVAGLALAYRGSRMGVCALLAGGYWLVHPTTILLAPVLTSVLLVQVIRRTHDRPVARWRAPLLTVVAAVAITVPVVLIGRSSFGAGWARKYYDVGTCDWAQFLVLYARSLLGLIWFVPPETVTWYQWRFWPLVLVVTLLGLERLVQRRAWDQLVLIGATVATLFGLYLAVGPHVAHPGASRYTLFLLVPMVLSFACLLRMLIVAPTAPGPRLATVRGLQFAACLAIGFALLGTAKTNYIDRHRTAEPGARATAWWPWTVRGEEIKPVQRIARLIQHDARRGPQASFPLRIATAGMWYGEPLEFLCARRPELRVESCEALAPPDRARSNIEVLRSGGYVVSAEKPDADPLLCAAFPRDALKVWVMPTAIPLPAQYYVVYRLRRSSDAPRPTHELSRGATDQAAGRR
jgi:hypothetical protein